MKYLETNSFDGSIVIVPVNRIQFVLARNNEEGWVVEIHSDKNKVWSENFGDDKDRAASRLWDIKQAFINNE